MKLWFFGLPACCFAVAVGCGGGDDDMGGAPGGKAGASAGEAGKGPSSGGMAGEGAAGGKGAAGGRGGGAGESGNPGGAGFGGSGDEAQAGSTEMGGTSAGGEAAGRDSGGQGGSGELAGFELEPASVSIAGTTEKFVCAVMDLGNTAPIHAGELHVTTSDVVFDLRVSAVSGSAAPTPVDCSGFGQLTDNSMRPLLFTRQRSEDIVFPAGTAYTLAEHQLLRFEIHVYNDGADPLDALAHLSVVPIDDASYEREAGLLVLYDHDVDVPTTQAASQTSYFKLPSGFDLASVFRATADVHQFGTEVTLATGAQSSGPFADFYDVTGTPPSSVKIAPAAVVPVSGGIQLGCSWNNVSQMEVMSGLSHTDEQCTGYLYYAPAVDTGLCLKDGGTVFCCSDAGGGCTNP